MQTRTLGRSAMPVSEIGLGCWQLGGDFGPIQETSACNIIEAAVEQGITFFDTADVYGGGRSEQYVGQVLKDAPSNIKIATKYGRRENTYPDGYSLDDLRDSVRYSQDRLQRDCIDLLQLHCVPKPLLERGEIFDWLNTITEEGMIASYGASVETLDEAMLCLHQPKLTSIQLIFNLFRQRPKQSLFTEAQKKDVGIIVRLPLASGVLSGKFTKKTQFDSSDHRNYNKDGKAFSVGETFSGIEFNKAVSLAEKLKHYTKGAPLAEFAQRWILDHPAVSTIITGASSIEQVKSNVAATELEPVSEEVHQELFELYLEKFENLIRCDL